MVLHILQVLDTGLMELMETWRVGAYLTDFSHLESIELGTLCKSLGNPDVDAADQRYVSRATVIDYVMRCEYCLIDFCKFSKV